VRPRSALTGRGGRAHVARMDRRVRFPPIDHLAGRAAGESAVAVYTDVSTEDLGAFLAGYDLGGALSSKGISQRGENSNFIVRTRRGVFILTLYEKRVAAEDLPFFLGLMEHLASRGITCPQPVKNRAGNAAGTLAGRPAAIVTFLEGMWVRRPSARNCTAVGDALANLHVAGDDFPVTLNNALTLVG